VNEPLHTVREISRITEWVNDMTDRRRRGETIPDAELVEYQRAKVWLLAEIAKRNPSRRAAAVLAAARADLARLEAASSGRLTLKGQSRRTGRMP
jgi:hypothetical protein